MWYAKLFGMIWNNLNKEIFTKDMVPDLFKKADRKNVQWHDEITTLDHLHHKSDPTDSVSREHSGFNIAIMLFLKEFMAMTTPSEGFDIPSGNGAELEKYLSNFKLYVLNIIIDILTIMNPSIPQKYIYDPEFHNCDDNVILWRKCLSMVKDDKLSEDKIWDEMRKQCDRLNTKSNKSLKGLVDVNSERYVTNSSIEKEHVLLYMGAREKVRSFKRNKMPIIRNCDENKFLKEDIIGLVLGCFKANNSKMSRHLKMSNEESMKILRDYIEELLMKFSTYLLIDHADIKEFISTDVKVQKNSNKFGVTGKEVHPVDIYGVMIVENDIQHKDATCTLIHFLCVKRGYEGLSYANKLMRYAFSDKNLQSTEVYAVSRLPPPYSVRHEDLQYRIRDDHHYHDRKILPDSYFTSQKLTLDYKDTACRDLVLCDSKILKLDPKKLQICGLCMIMNPVQCIVLTMQLGILLHILLIMSIMPKIIFLDGAN